MKSLLFFSSFFSFSGADLWSSGRTHNVKIWNHRWDDVSLKTLLRPARIKLEFFCVKQIEMNLVSLKNVWNNIWLSERNLLTELPEECLNSEAHRDTKNVEQTRTVDRS